MTMVHEILDLLSQKQKIEIRLVPNGDFTESHTIIKGLLKLIDYKTLKNIERMPIIGLASMEDYIWIYIENR